MPKKKPAILSPINSFEGAERVIRAGADELYCDVRKGGKLKNFTLFRDQRCEIPTRFLGEKSPETCHRPCITRAFLLKPTDINIKLFLYGNVVFRLIPPSQEDLKKLLKSGVTEFIIDMNPITKIQSRQEIDEFIFKLKP